MRLNGVVSAGTLTDVDLKGQLVRAVPVNDPQGQTQFQMPVKAASPGLFDAVRATLATRSTARCRATPSGPTGSRCSGRTPPSSSTSPGWTTSPPSTSAITSTS